MLTVCVSVHKYVMSLYVTPQFLNLYCFIGMFCDGNLKSHVTSVAIMDITRHLVANKIKLNSSYNVMYITVQHKNRPTQYPIVYSLIKSQQVFVSISK